MSQTIFTLILFLGGIFMYLVHLLTFESHVPNIYKLLGIILACIPVIGFIAYTIIFLFDVFSYQKDCFTLDYVNGAVIRDTWLNRILFNDVDWLSYDKRNEQKRIKALNAAKDKEVKEMKKAEEKRREKLIKGLYNQDSPYNPKLLKVEPIAPVVKQ